MMPLEFPHSGMIAYQMRYLDKTVDCLSKKKAHHDYGNVSLL